MTLGKSRRQEGPPGSNIESFMLDDSTTDFASHLVLGEKPYVCRIYPVTTGDCVVPHGKPV